jgi:hypothetical protein
MPRVSDVAVFDPELAGRGHADCTFFWLKEVTAMNRPKRPRSSQSELASTLHNVAARVRAAAAKASDITPTGIQRSGDANVAIATTVSRDGATSGAFSEQTADGTRRGVLTDDGWAITEDCNER